MAVKYGLMSKSGAWYRDLQGHRVEYRSIFSARSAAYDLPDSIITRVTPWTRLIGFFWWIIITIRAKYWLWKIG